MSDATVDSLATSGELLKYLRRRMQLTQRELGAALGYSAPCGVCGSRFSDAAFAAWALTSTFPDSGGTR